jgi:hypothetical protein
LTKLGPLRGVRGEDRFDAAIDVQFHRIPVHGALAASSRFAGWSVGRVTAANGRPFCGRSFF